MLMPADAVLRASRAAIETLNGNGHKRPSNGESVAPERLAALIVREMNMRPESC
jgi:hypothetical protein